MIQTLKLEQPKRERVKTVVFLLFFTGFLFLGFIGKASATTYTVCSSGCNQTTIQDAFNNYDLAPGDIVEVQADTPGGSKIYNEMVTWGSNDAGSVSGQVCVTG